LLMSWLFLYFFQWFGRFLFVVVFYPLSCSAPTLWQEFVLDDGYIFFFFFFFSFLLGNFGSEFFMI
jgi:hypothetical protein